MKLGIKFLGKLMDKMAPYILFTSRNTASRSLNKGARGMLLDVGCGEGGAVRLVNKDIKQKLFTVGVDIFLPYLCALQKLKSYDELVLCDVRIMPFRPKSFDTVVCLSVIEHLEKEQGLRLINDLEQIAQKWLIIGIPVGFYEQEVEYNSNPYQVHRSGYTPDEFEELGYKVRGHGAQILWGNRGLIHWFHPTLRWLVYILYFLVGPIAYYFPRLASYMICIKSFDSHLETNKGDN